MSDRDNGGVPIQVVCKEKGIVVNPRMVTFGGADLDVEWLDKCDCKDNCKYGES